MFLQSLIAQAANSLQAVQKHFKQQDVKNAKTHELLFQSPERPVRKVKEVITVTALAFPQIICLQKPNSAAVFTVCVAEAKCTNTTSSFAAAT